MRFLGFELFKQTKISDIKPGEGGVINREGRKIAIFKHKNGKLETISAKCTHMGCTVHWNNIDKTWDCPCHGSRYDQNGKVINGPAVKNLEPIT